MVEYLCHRYTVERVLEQVPRIQEDGNDGVCVCKNGVYDLKTCELTLFLNEDGTENPEYIKKYKEQGRHFFHKLATDYNEDAELYTFVSEDDEQYQWNVETHLEQVFASLPEEEAKASIKAMWEFMGSSFCGRGAGRMLILCDSTRSGGVGGGGKSSTLNIIKEVIGEKNIFVKSFHKTAGRFALAGLVGKLFIMGTESTHKTITESDIIKLLSRNEAVEIEEKYKNSIPYYFKGAAAFAMQRPPRFEAKDPAIFRKLLILKCGAKFTQNGKDREYIGDFISDIRTREYILYKALNEYGGDGFSEETARVFEKNNKEAREAYDSVSDFARDVLPTIKNEYTPLEAVHAAYIMNCQRQCANPTGKDLFTERLESFIEDNGLPFRIIPKNEGPRGLSVKSEPEEYLDKYRTDWSGEQSAEGNACKYSTSKTGHTYRGWLVKTGEIKAKQQTITMARTENDKIRDYLNFRGAWYNLHIEEIAAGTLKPDEIPKREEWEAQGSPLPIYHHHYKDGYILGGWYADGNRVYNPDFTDAEDRDLIMAGTYPEAYLPNRAEFTECMAEKGVTVPEPQSYMPPQGSAYEGANSTDRNY